MPDERPMLDPKDAAVERLCAQIGHALRQARLYRLRTVEDVASEVGVSAKRLIGIERGNEADLSLRLIGLIAYALQFDLDFKVHARAKAADQPQ